LFNLSKRNEILFVLCLEGGLMFVGVGFTTPILPLYAQSFGVSFALVGLVVTVFGLSRMLADLPAGQLADRLGRRPPLIVGPFLSAIAALGAGLATGFWQLVLFRALQGVGSALYTTGAFTVIADISTPQNRARTMSIYNVSILLGHALGPVVGGVVAQHFGLRVPFFWVAGISLATATWAYLRLRETKDWLPKHEIASHPVDDLGINQETVAAGTLKSLLTSRNFILVSLVGASILFTRSGARQTLIPLMGFNLLDLTASQVGLAYTLTGLVSLAILYPVGSLADRFGRKAVIVSGSMFVASALMLFAGSGSYSHYLAASILFGGTAFLAPVVAAAVADIAPPGRRGTTMGLYRTVCDLGFVAGPLVLGLKRRPADVGK
jgi:multidrug resistance protein